MKFKHAETLDLCMEQLFSFIDREHGRDTNSRRKLKDLLLDIFENLILPTYNSHHIQFSIFYYCSLKVSKRGVQLPRTSRRSLSSTEILI